MNRKLLTVVLLLGLVSFGEARAQSVLMRTYYGCGLYSCHKYDLTIYPYVPEWGPNAFLWGWSRLFPPRGLGAAVPTFKRFDPTYQPARLDFFGDYGLYDPKWGVPDFWDLYTSFGPIGGNYHAGDEVMSEWVRLSATPEPATLLLLASGLVAVSIRARRRRGDARV